jgi:hypothetical protein
MSGIGIRRARARRRRIIATVATGAVVLAGATVTSLATWLDEEWVTAGVDGDAGLTASTFEIEQQLAGDGTDWFDRETAGAAGVVDFDDVAQSLSPGAVAYGWVRLRAADGSVSGDLDLVSDYTLGDSPLGDVLTYGARVHPTSATCNLTSYGATGSALVADGSALTADSGSSFHLDAGSGAAGTAQVVCFRIVFPDASTPGEFDLLQGEDADVVWYFDVSSS